MSAFYLDLSCYDWLSMIQFPEFPHATFLASHIIESCNARALREGRPIDLLDSILFEKMTSRLRHPEPVASSSVGYAAAVIPEIPDTDVADRRQEVGYGFREDLPPKVPIVR